MGLVLLAGPALAQDAPLTTLMRPQPLERPAPLGRADELGGESPLTNVPSLLSGGPLAPQRQAGTKPTKPGEPAAPCDAQAGAQRPSSAGYASGGSGPGEYERFVDGGRGADTAKPPAPVRHGPGDRPLNGDSARPLWGDPAPRVAAPTSREAPGQASGQSSGDAHVPAAPTAGFDRPLWAEGSAAAPGSEGCDAQRGAPPGQTLYFGVAPAR